ncbi:solute carrier family 15 member 1-like isoform X2 [Tachypleus tridentatus]
MKAVLTLYLTMVLLYDEDTATMIYHTFSMGCYFTPLFGAMLADSFLGKFKTIFYVSIVYVMGNIILSSASIPNFLPMTVMSMIGLTLIAIGTGGIKPCVSAFGGDQFGPGQKRQLQSFFSLFYLSINAGSLLSTFLTPIFRADIHCFGNNTCYPLAFGVPSILMIIALALFLCGKPFYNIIPPQGNIVLRVLQCIFYALKRKVRITKNENRREHWLDYADDKYDLKLIEEIKVVLYILRLYIPLPVFWALFDQQGSRWTLQATRMNGTLGNYSIKPDQMQVINPLLIVVFIPLFEYIIYPILAKCNCLTRSLQRITAGGLLAASSFFIAGFLQIKIESSLPLTPAAGFSQFGVINTLPCHLNLIGPRNITLEPGEVHVSENVKANKTYKISFAADGCDNFTRAEDYNVTLASGKIQTMMATSNSKNIVLKNLEDPLRTSKTGTANVQFFLILHKNLKQQPKVNFTLIIKGKENTYFVPLDFEKFSTKGLTIGSMASKNIIPGEYNLYLPVANSTWKGNLIHPDAKIGTFYVRNGGSYILTLVPMNHTEKLGLHMYTIIQPNEISMFLQIPQYMVITAGEIMFSVTGLEFSYSQAPSSMKSVLQAAWLLTVAFGNLIVVIVAKLQLFHRQSHEFLMFASLMVAVMLLFAVMAYFYKYVHQPQREINVIDKSNTEITSRENVFTNEAFGDDKL